MKAFALAAVLMVGVSVLSAMNIFPSENTRCRDLAKAPSERTADLRVAQDLMNGAWSLSAGERYEFHENGRLFIFSENMEATVCQWEVNIYGGMPVLEISDKNGILKTYKVEQTCAGITLTNLVNHDAFILDYIPMDMPGHGNKIKTKLSGEWTNVTFFESTQKCDNANGAYLNYVFDINGTYTCKYGSQSNRHMEMGVWAVSKDGQFLLLTTKMGSTSVLRIANVDGHGLILEQAMTTNDISEFFCSEQTSFAFIK